MTRFLYGALALCFALASCGGGGGSVESVPVIRFVGTYDFACSNCSPPREARLSLAPVAGATTLGSRDIAKVELSVEHGPAQVLTAPNSKNSAGQATYVFFFPRTTPLVPNLARVCTPPIALEITVTDVGGFAFKKYFNACNAGEFGAFSDYGDRTVTYRAVTTAPTRASFTRGGAGGYLDAGSSAAGATTSTWTLKARDADTLGAGSIFDASTPDGAVTTVSIEGEGGALASSTLATKTTRSTGDAFLVCCGFGAAAQSPPSSASTRTVSFVIDPVQYGVDVTKALQKFNVYYRVYDPGSGTVIAEFQGAGDGYTVWSFPVKAGYELKLEASPQSAVTDVQVYITDFPYTGNSLGFARSNRPDAPAKLKVFCCAR